MARLVGCFQRSVRLGGLFLGTQSLVGRALDRFRRSVHPTAILYQRPLTIRIADTGPRGED